MRFGVCAAADRAPLLARIGYHYIELSVAADLAPEEDDAAWSDKRRMIDAMPLCPEAFNSFIRTGKIVGPDADFPRLRRYVETALTRAAAVSGRIIVFGSGGARQIPEGFPPDEAERQILDFLNLCADASATTGVTVVIEPLCRDECNVINLVSEGARLARLVGRPGVANLGDTYHMEKENEPLSALVDSADVLAHVHTADTDRLAPGTGTYDHIALFRTLRTAGYEARVSVECGWHDFEVEAAAAFAHLTSALDASH